MENIYYYLTPIAIGLLLFEIGIHLIGSKKLFSFQELIANLGTAIMNQMMNVFVLFLVIKTYGFLHSNYSLTTIEMNWWTGLILLFSIDFLFYWFHRWGHEINILWAAHSPHHSAEEMNLGVGLRASVTQRLFSFTMFWPLTLIGFEPIHIYMMTGVHLMLGYWHHTEAIGKMGWFEKWFNTPSYHRVHHGVNPQYIDKNYAELLIIWDKMFGTCKVEEEPVVYGVTNHPQSYNPFKINFQYYMVLWEQAKNMSLKDKFKIWFMPTGWKMESTTSKFDRFASEYKRYTSIPYKFCELFLSLDVLVTLGVMTMVINLNNSMEAATRALLVVCILAKTVSWGGILEQRSWSPWLSLATSSLLFAIVSQGGIPLSISYLPVVNVIWFGFAALYVVGIFSVLPKVGIIKTSTPAENKQKVA